MKKLTLAEVIEGIEEPRRSRSILYTLDEGVIDKQTIRLVDHCCRSLSGENTLLTAARSSSGSKTDITITTALHRLCGAVLFIYG